MNEEEWQEAKKREFSEKTLGAGQPHPQARGHLSLALINRASQLFSDLKETKLIWPVLDLPRYNDDNNQAGSKESSAALDDLRHKFDRIDLEAFTFLDAESLHTFISGADDLRSILDGYTIDAGNQISLAHFAEIAAKLLSIRESLLPALIKLITITSALRHDDLARRINDADRLLEVLREGLGYKAFHTNAAFFDDIAQISQKNALGWSKRLLWIILAISASAILLIIFRDNSYLATDTSAEAIQMIGLKIIFFGTLSYAAGFCAKDYRAERHNYVANLHRATAIKTYRALMEASTSANAQDIILTQAATSIFGIGETGFSGTGRTSDQGPQINIGSLIPRTPISS